MSFFLECLGIVVALTRDYVRDLYRKTILDGVTKLRSRWSCGALACMSIGGFPAAGT